MTRFGIATLNHSPLHGSPNAHATFVSATWHARGDAAPVRGALEAVTSELAAARREAEAEGGLSARLSAEIAAMQARTTANSCWKAIWKV